MGACLRAVMAEAGTVALAPECPRCTRDLDPMPRH